MSIINGLEVTQQGAAVIEGTLLLYGGLPPYTTELVDGELPEGLELVQQGRYISIAGTFQPQGAVDFTIRATSDNGLEAVLRVYLESETDYLMPPGADYVLPRLVPPGTLSIQFFDLPTRVPQ